MGDIVDLYVLGMHDDNGERYGAFVRCGTFKRQNMRHLFWGDNRKGASRWASFWHFAQLQSHLLFAMHSKVATGKEFWQYNNPSMSRWVMIQFNHVYTKIAEIRCHFILSIVSIQKNAALNHIMCVQACIGWIRKRRRKNCSVNTKKRFNNSTASTLIE